MGACAKRQIGFAFCTPRGKFLARVCGEDNGNVLLRRSQYRIADDPVQCCRISRTMIFGKLFNARWSIERTRRDHGLRVDSEKLTATSQQIYGLLPQVKDVTVLEELRPCVADRFVLTLINNRQVKSSGFLHMESGAVLLTDDGRKTFLKSWQEKKKRIVDPPLSG